MLRNLVLINILALGILPFSLFAQNKADTTVTVEDGVKTVTITTVEPVDDTAKSDTAEQYEEYLASIDTTSLGSNLNLQAVAELFRTSKDLEEFEKKLNDKDEGVNNLDLNEDGETDYLRVLDHAEDKTHVIVIQAVIAKDQFQDVASIDVVQEGDKVSLQIVGDEDIYGTDYYIEPEKQEEVKDYPAVQVIFVAGYSPYYSPYYWGYYPPYYHPWHPYPPHYYHRHVYHRHVYHPHHHGYHHGHGHANPHARSVYNSNRKTAPINKTKRYNNNAPQRPVNKTRPVNSKPQKPSTRPAQPSKKPSQKPQTRPAQPSKAAKPATRPAQPSKATKPATRPQTPKQPSARPAQPRQARPSARPAGRSGGGRRR